jgi:hypothetical protein
MRVQQLHIWRKNKMVISSWKLFLDEKKEIQFIVYYKCSTLYIIWQYNETSQSKIVSKLVLCRIWGIRKNYNKIKVYLGPEKKDLSIHHLNGIFFANSTNITTYMTGYSL